MLAICLLALPATALAKGDQEIVRIHSGKQWRLNDSICFQKKDQIVACGKVIGTSSYLVAIRVPRLHEKVSRGDRLLVAAAGPGRQPTSYGDTYVVTRTTPRFIHALTTGFFSNNKIFFPMVHVQAGLGRGWLLGVMPSYGSKPIDGTSVNALGTLATLEWFFTGNPLNGFSLQSAAGVYSVRASGDTAWLATGQMTLGWSFVTHGGFTMGIAGGGQYTSDSALAGTELLTRFQPLFRANIGWAF